MHEPLRNHDSQTRRAVERIEEIGRAARSEDLGGNDIVHADLHPGNLLQSSGRLTVPEEPDG